MKGVAAFPPSVYDSPGIACDRAAVSVTPSFRSSVAVAAVTLRGIVCRFSERRWDVTTFRSVDSEGPPQRLHRKHRPTVDWRMRIAQRLLRMPTRLERIDAQLPSATHFCPTSYARGSTTSLPSLSTRSRGFKKRSFDFLAEPNRFGFVSICVIQCISSRLAIAKTSKLRHLRTE